VVEDRRLTMKVLLVEDSESDAALVRAQLGRSRERFDTVRAASCAGAMEQLERTAFDAVLLALDLGDSSGLATLQQLLRECGHTPVLVLTGRDDDTIGVQAVRAGAHDFLPKSRVTPEGLSRALRHARERAQFLAERREERDRFVREQGELRARGLKALARLAGGIAHEFNNQLMVIGGNQELLAELAPEDCQSFVARTLASVDRAAKVAGYLAAFAGRGPESVPDLPVDATLCGIERSLTKGLPPDVAVSFDLAASDAAVALTHAELGHVVSQLFRNAVVAVGTAGHIAVASRQKRGPRRRAVTLEVVDDGVGMDADTLAKACEPFFTTHPTGEGMGLGLSVVHGIVAQAGGSLELVSRPGLGTTVTVTLPHATDQSFDMAPSQ